MKNSTSNPESIGSGIARAAVIIAFMWFFWKLGGLLMLWLVNRYYDTGLVTDVFTSVYGPIVYTIFYASTLAVFKPAFMPLFAERRQKYGEADAWRLVNTCLNLLLLLAMATAVVAFIFAPTIIGTLLPKFSAEAKAAAVILMRWMLPGLLVMVFAITALAVLTSYKDFFHPSASDALQKLTWAAGLFIAISVLKVSRAPEFAPHVIGATFLIGSAAQATLLLYAMRRHLRLYRFGLPALSSQRIRSEIGWFLGTVSLAGVVVYALHTFNRLPETHSLHLGREHARFWSVTALILIGTAYALLLRQRGRSANGIMGRFAMLASPLLIGVIFGRYSTFAEARFQSYTAEGEFSLIEYAKRVSNLPVILVGYALSVAMIPYLCDLAAGAQRSELGKLVGRTLRFMALFFLPLTVVTMVLAQPIMRLLWDKGSWTQLEAGRAALALGILATTIFFFAIENVLMQSFFSIQQTALPTIVGIGRSIVHALALYVTIDVFGWDSYAFVIVCIALAGSRGLKEFVLAFCLHRQVPLMDRQSAVRFGWRLLLICLATGGAALLLWPPMRELLPLTEYIPEEGTRREQLVYAGVKFVRLAVPSLGAAAAFVVMCLVLRMEEFGMAVTWARERIRGRWG